MKDIEPVAAVEATVVREGANKTPKNNVLVVVAGVAALVVVVLVVALSLRGSKSQAEGEATAVVPPVDPERLESIRSILAPISGEAVFDPDSEEFSVDRIEALDWLVEEDRKSPFPLDDETQLWHIRQLYVLAVFYFATGGDDWQHQYKFLQGTNECDWNADESQRECIKDIEVCDCEDGEECLVSNDNDPRGIVCNDQGRVTNIATCTFERNKKSQTPNRSCTVLKCVRMCVFGFVWKKCNVPVCLSASSVVCVCVCCDMQCHFFVFPFVSRTLTLLRCCPTLVVSWNTAVRCCVLDSRTLSCNVPRARTPRLVPTNGKPCGTYELPISI